MAEASKVLTFRRFTIIGTGLIGCSVAAILKEKRLAAEIVGVDREPAHLEIARQLGLIDLGLDDPARGVIGADGVLLAVPLHELFVVMQAAGPDIKPNALVTCTAGTTMKLRRQMLTEIPNLQNFVPSFPLIFSAARGPAASAAQLISGQQCVVGTHPEFPGDAVLRVSRLWKELGLLVDVRPIEEFEWVVAAGFLWPLLVGAAASKVTEDRGWAQGSSVLRQWLGLVEQAPDLQRTDQLYARKLCTLLADLRGRLAALEQSLGGGVQSDPPPAGGKNG